MKLFKKIILAVSSIVLLAIVDNAFATQVTATQAVTMTVINSCTVTAPAAVNFTDKTAGTTTGANEDVTANAVVNCAGVGAVLLGIDSGTNGTAIQRNMKHATLATLIPYTVLTVVSTIGTTGLTPPPALPFTASPASFTSVVGNNNVSVTVRLPASTVIPTDTGVYSSTLTYYAQF